MQKFIDSVLTLLVVASLALVVLLVAKPSRGDEIAAMTLLRHTALRIDGVGCSGSGSIVEGASGSHFILTNDHVCLCASYEGKIFGTFEGGKLVTGQIMKRSWEYDLCAARVDLAPDSLKIAENKPGFLDHVFTRGYPGGRLAESSGEIRGDVRWDAIFDIGEIGSCPPGSIAEDDIRGVLEGCRMEFTSTLSNLYGRPGSSGSPVVNAAGKLVGVISSWHPGNLYDAGETTFEQTRQFLSNL